MYSSVLRIYFRAGVSLVVSRTVIAFYMNQHFEKKRTAIHVIVAYTETVVNILRFFLLFVNNFQAARLPSNLWKENGQGLRCHRSIIM